MNMRPTGIGEVTVKKEDLLIILRKNREAHHQTFDEAMVKFRERAIEGLDNLISELRRGRTPRSLALGLPLPEEHINDYDRVIHMLEMHQGDTIELTEQAYSQLCDDDWGWKHAFASNTMSYVGSGEYA